MKNKMLLSTLGVIFSIILTIVSAIVVDYKIIDGLYSYILITLSTILLIVSVISLAKVDYQTSVYECKKCSNTFKPTFKSYIFGAHTINTRYLTCPQCKNKSWCTRKK